VNSQNHLGRVLFAKALAGLLVFDALTLCCDFKTIHRVVHRWKFSDTDRPEGSVQRVCEAMNSACGWYPKQVLCLQRAAVTTCLLRDCGIPAQMVLGAQRLPFKAHAWVEVEGAVVNELTDVKSVYREWERC
jgi:Transglutaminase-like superfamily